MKVRSESAMAALVVRGDAQPSCFDRLPCQLLDSLLDDRRLAGSEQVEFCRTEIDPDDLVPVTRQTGRRDTSDVPHSKDADLHG